MQQAGIAANNPNVFLRPHDLLITHYAEDSTVPAVVDRIVYLGWELQVELLLDDGQTITAYLTREQSDRLNLQPQQQVFVKTRKARSFALSH